MYLLHFFIILHMDYCCGRAFQKAISRQIISQEDSYVCNFIIYEINRPDIKTQNSFDKERVRTAQKPPIKPGSNTCNAV